MRIARAERCRTGTRHAAHYSCKPHLSGFRGVRHGASRRTRFRNPLDFKWISDFRMDFWISKWISGFQSGFLDFKVDFWIQSGFLDFKADFWISKWISRGISGFQANFWISKRISGFADLIRRKSWTLSSVF